jgi:hypothetical protein
VTGTLPGTPPSLLPEAEGGARPVRRRLKVATAVVAAVVALFLAAVTGYALHRPAPAALPEAHSPAGAKLAAEDIAVDLGSVHLIDPAWRGRFLAAKAMPGAVPYLRATLDEVATRVIHNLGVTNPKTGATAHGQYVSVSATIPEGTSVDTYTGTTARVSVWTTGVTGVAGPSSAWPLSSAYVTGRVSLQWDGTRWRLTDNHSLFGPVPAPAPQPVSPYRDIMTRLGGGVS